jgi:hypothetical protein
LADLCPETRQTEARDGFGDGDIVKLWMFGQVKHFRENLKLFL